MAALADGESVDRRLLARRRLRRHARLPARARGRDPARPGRPPSRSHGRGLGGLRPAPEPLDAVNSGTTLRLHVRHPGRAPDFKTVISGDESLQRRPMRRIIEPLTKMGARIESINDRAPLTIRGGSLHAITHEPAVPSAQVKSGVLLAGLHATGTTRVIENVPTRDHTERAFTAFGVEVVQEGATIAVAGGQRLQPGRLTVPGDISGCGVLGRARGRHAGFAHRGRGCRPQPVADRRPRNLQTRRRRR